MTKEKMVGETNMKTEQVWYSSCSVADDDNDDDEDDKCDDIMMVMMIHSTAAPRISGRK